MRLIYRAQVVRVSKDLRPIPGWRWDIPVLFHNWDDAVAAAAVAARRKISRFGGEWSIDIRHERVFIL